jgi:hypothetical protein
MKSGHAKNVANFEIVTLILSARGAIYDPAEPSIRLAALKTKLEEARAVLVEVDADRRDKTARLNDLEAELGDLDKYVAGLKRAAEAELNDPHLTRSLQNIVDLFNSKKRAAGVSNNPLTIGINESRTALFIARRERDNQILHLAEMFALLKPRADFHPADPQYRVSAIEARLIALTVKNIAAKASEAALGSSEAARDRILYDPDSGLLKLVKLVKSELARKPGRDSAVYQQVSVLEFRKY